MGSHGTAIAAALIALLIGACEPSGPNRAVSAKAASADGEGIVRDLDFEHPAIVVPVAAVAREGSGRFVLVEIGEVINPARIALTFEVGFRPAAGGETRLGGFSLYPADNPGRFIVATQGRVRPDGRIVVTLEGSDAEGARSVRVRVARIALVDS